MVVLSTINTNYSHLKPITTTTYKYLPICMKKEKNHHVIVQFQRKSEEMVVFPSDITAFN